MYNLTFKKTKSKTKQNELIDRENRLVVAGGGGKRREWKKWVKVKEKFNVKKKKEQLKGLQEFLSTGCLNDKTEK